MGVAVADWVLLVIVELTILLGISVGFKVPHVVHVGEPGVSRRHCLKLAEQILFGTVLMYLAMSGGEVPFAQTHE